MTSSVVLGAHQELYAADLNINEVPLGMRVCVVIIHIHKKYI